MRKPIAYLAGPLGFSEVGRLFHNTVLIPLVKEAGFDIRDPWTLTSPELISSILALPYGKARRKGWLELNYVIGANNERAIIESDIIVAVLDGVDVDSGTAGEIGYGTALGRITIGYRGDFRLSSDNEGCTINLQIEYFINKNGGEIVTSIEALRSALVACRERLFLPK